MKFIEDLELIGLKKIKNWNGLTKLENLKTLKLNCCEIQQDQSDSFFKNLYSLKKLEYFSINDFHLCPESIGRPRANLICYVAGIVKMPIQYLLIGITVGEILLIGCYVYMGVGLLEWVMG